MLKTREIADRKKISRQETIELLNEHKEALFKDIANNVSYRKIAENFNIHLTNLHHYLNLEENQQAKDLALEIASYDMLDNAESELHKIQDDSSNATVRRQCELYQHKMYIAKVKNRKEFDLNYKENQDINNTQQIVVIPANFTKQINTTEN
jgi:hypothetical protein